MYHDVEYHDIFHNAMQNIIILCTIPSSIMPSAICTWDNACYDAKYYDTLHCIMQSIIMHFVFAFHNG